MKRVRPDWQCLNLAYKEMNFINFTNIRYRIKITLITQLINNTIITITRANHLRISLSMQCLTATLDILEYLPQTELFQQTSCYKQLKADSTHKVRPSPTTAKARMTKRSEYQK